jgi:murein DD-endopeptidase MepM/ murein hydrolase activator NlpD
VEAPTPDTRDRTRTPRRGVATLACAGAALALAAGAASAEAGGGGTIAPGTPKISDVVCVTNCIKPRKGIVKSKIRITGTELQTIRVVSLPRSDGKRSKDTDPTVKPSGAVVAFVRKGAITGAVRVADAYSQTADSPADFKVGTMAQLRRAQQKFIFPVRGPHQYWDGLGAGRGHMGQDIGAACKTKVVAAHGGKVIERSGKTPDGAAGNYLMLYDKKGDRTYLYMHFVNPPVVPLGSAVTTRQHVGNVGHTGDATGCHLHFEMHEGKGWGGTLINPTPLLKYWDSYS